MQIRILGAAAGGGLPQWNCRCPNCVSARKGSPDVVPLTQSSVAISADGARWYILNVSPDIRQQIQSFSPLTPDGNSMRGTGIAGCVLTDAELDHSAGLLFLREGTLFQIYSTPVVRRWLKEKFPVEPILSAFRPRPWSELSFTQPVNLIDADGEPSSLWVATIDLPSHPPLYVGHWPDSTAGSVVALLIEDKTSGKSFLYAPGVEKLTPGLEAAANAADALFIDGTFWSLNEMIDLGLSERNALDMGHLPISGNGGTLEWMRNSRAALKVYFHINNTNPILNAASPERKVIESAGIRVGRDGDTFEL